MELLRSINAEFSEKETLKSLKEAGLLKKGLGKLAGAVGMKGTAANLQAQGESAQKIKQLKIAFQQFAGQLGKTLKTATSDDLLSFFKAKQLPAARQLSQIKKGAALSSLPSGTLDSLFKVAIQGGAKRQMRQQGQQPAQQGQQPAQQGQQPAQKKGGNVGQKLQQVIAGLSPSQANGLIAALQSAR